MQDCVTRWNSTADMIEQFLKVKQYVDVVAMSSDAVKQLIDEYTPVFDTLMKQLVVLLKPFRTATQLVLSCFSFFLEKYANAGV